MSVIVETSMFPGPQPSAPPVVGSSPSNRRWSAFAGSDIVRRTGALAAFALAVIIVMLSAGGAWAQVDTDNDGLSDADESGTYGTDPAIGDSDGDGLPDGVEVDLGTNPLEADSDGDGATDAEEYLAGDDPLVAVAAPVVVAVTQVPTTVPARSGVEADAVQTQVTVSPEVAEVVPTDVLAFTEVGAERPRLWPLYILFAVAIGVVMFRAVVSMPQLHADRTY